MKYASRNLLLSLVILVLTTSSSWADDALWSKATAIVTASKNEFPQRMTETEEVHDMSGKLEEQSQSSFRLTLDASLAPHIELVRSTKNGTDDTKAKRKELGNGYESEILGESGNPFLDKAQDHVTYARSKMKRKIDGQHCIGYRYEIRSKTDAEKGVVFLDAETGLPRLKISVPNTLPRIEGVTIKKMIVSNHYYVTKSGKWRTKRVVIKTRISVKVMPQVIFEGRVTTTLAFADYLSL